MGNNVVIKKSKQLANKIFKQQTLTFLILGLDKSGKTMLLFKQKYGQVQEPPETVGFNVESVLISGIKIEVFEVGGSSNIRKIWPMHYSNINSLFWVIDCSDKSRFEESRLELGQILQDNSFASDTPVFILANKMDKPTAISVKSISEELRIDELKLLHKGPVAAYPVIGKSGQGVLQAFQAAIDVVVNNGGMTEKDNGSLSKGVSV